EARQLEGCLNAFHRTGDRCVNLTTQRLEAYTGRAPDLAAQLGNRSWVQGPVWVGWRLGASKAADVRGRDHLGRTPAGVIEPCLLPAERKHACVEGFHGHAPGDRPRHIATPLVRPRPGLACLQPASLATHPAAP